jgi:hypothetical protein
MEFFLDNRQVFGCLSPVELNQALVHVCNDIIKISQLHLRGVNLVSATKPPDDFVVNNFTVANEFVQGHLIHPLSHCVVTPLLVFERQAQHMTDLV